MAAQLPATDTDTANHLRLITNTDLTELDPCLEYRCQILYQFTEINSSICNKVEQYFIIVKCILGLDQLHIKLMFCNLLFTDSKCLLALFFIIFVSFLIFISSYSYDRL